MKKISEKERFDRNVVKPENLSGCWGFDASLKEGRYPSFYFRGKGDRAHRVSWILNRGEIPEDMCVCHSCDNSECVNPDHLFLGSHVENMHDMVQKDRIPFGEGHSAAKLTNAKVIEMRFLRRIGWTVKMVADEFGINQGTMSRILRKKIWRRCP